MADISSISGAGEGPYRTPSADRAAPTTSEHGRVETPRRTREADSVSLSNAARSASKAESPEVRGELTARVRAELEAGTYVTPEKLDAAVERLVDAILRD